jgi:hypothetical protein
MCARELFRSCCYCYCCYCYCCYCCYRRIVQKRRGCFHIVHHRPHSVPQHRPHSVPRRPWTYTPKDPKIPKSQKSGPVGHGCWTAQFESRRCPAPHEEPPSVQKTGETRRLLPSEVESHCSQDLSERMEWQHTVPQSR